MRQFEGVRDRTGVSLSKKSKKSRPAAEMEDSWARVLPRADVHCDVICKEYINAIFNVYGTLRPTPHRTFGRK